MRANCENSSTSDLSDSTSATMARAHSSTSRRVGSGASAKCRFRRSADSWIGVSGFLISCASRRATSRHAATFCARTSGVTSSTTRTLSSAPPSPPSVVVAASRCRSWPSRTSVTSCCAAVSGGAATRHAAVAGVPAGPPAGRRWPRAGRAHDSAASGRRSSRPNTVAAGAAERVGVEREQPPRHRVDDADVALRVEADDAGGDALEDGLEVAPPRVGLEALALQIERAIDRAAAGSRRARSPSC